MARATLGLAFLVLGSQFCFPRLFGYLGVAAVQFLELMLCAPAIALGIATWFRGRSFANSWPVMLCALLLWLGLAYAERSESKRGLYYATVMTLAVPLGALIAHKRAWGFCAKAFVLGCAVGTLVVGCLQLGVEGGWRDLAHVRFGLYYVKWKTNYMTNPNEVGFHLAQGTVLAFLLYLRSRGAAPQSAACRSSGLGLAWTILLLAGCVLTLSRGAFVGCLLGLGLLALFGTRTQPLSKVTELLAATCLGIILVLLFTAASGHMPWEGMKARFLQEDNVATLGDRTEIWRNVFRALGSKGKYLFIGTGTGMASQVLGQFDPGAMVDAYGRLHRSCHNLFLDWVLSYGLLGLFVGSCAMVAMWHQAFRLDRREGSIDRRAFLATVMVLGMTGVMYQHGCTLATGSLVLAMLCDAPLLGNPQHSTFSGPACSPCAASDARWVRQAAGAARKAPWLVTQRGCL